MAKSLPRKVKVGFRVAMASQSFWKWKTNCVFWRNTCPPHPPPCWLNSQPTCPCCSPPLLSHPLCCFFPLAYTYPGLRWCPSPRPRKWLWFQFWNFPSNIQFIYSFPLREIPPCWPPSQPHSQPTCPSPHSWPLPPPWLPCQTTCTSPHPWPPPS